ncbi:hypothetical protein D0B54_22975 [Solimonas sp. K1W22B-7]|nr:hypothetical protein D0B54_22975 [Solimonas sp. K1W22B-7]
MIAGQCFVSRGAVRYTFDADQENVLINAGEYALFPEGGYWFDVDGGEEVEFFLIWEIPIKYRQKVQGGISP